MNERAIPECQRGWGIPLVVGLLLVVGCGTRPTLTNPPVITSLEPASGPSGTTVTVRGERFGTGGTVIFDGTGQTTHGTGSPLVATVPYDAATGARPVQVLISGIESAPVEFQVTSTAAAPAPVLDGWEIGYLSLAASADEDLMEIVGFGTGLDTNVVLEFNGSALASFTPGIPAGSLVGIFAGAATLSGFPPNQYNRAVAAYLTASAGTLPALGSTHTLRARNNVTGAVSNTLNINIPTRRAMIEMDRLTGVDWFPVAVLQNNRVNTIRRSYTEAGILLDRRYDEQIDDPRDPAGGPFTNADVISFRDAAMNRTDNVFSGEWYVHLSLLTSSTTNGLLGRMFDTANRQGTVVFASAAPTQANYLRTTVHELGHALNLTHCEGDAVMQRDASGNLVIGANGRPVIQTMGVTMMNQTRALANNWGFQFSADSETHLRTHALNEVRPGSGNLAFNSASRVEGACDY